MQTGDYLMNRRRRAAMLVNNFKQTSSGSNSAGDDHIYAAIDMKSFFASVECVERQLNPLTANLVVADPTRTDKTICLAVSPSLKAYGIPGRPRLFEVVQRVKEVNARRKFRAPKKQFTGESADDTALKEDPALALSYITAPPRMALYKKYSHLIYETYQEFISPEDIHVYSIDEVFIDLTPYLKVSRQTPHQLTIKLIRAVLAKTGITATAGIGPNLYLAKVAMDIVAKKIPPDGDGVRIAQLTVEDYQKKLWSHRPITDFWQVGKGYQKRLAAHHLYTMGDIARCSQGGPKDYFNEALLYRLFGINAGLLICHAWGKDPTTLADIRAYVPKSTSLSSGQVLQTPYPAGKAAIIVREMADNLSGQLVKKNLFTDRIVLTVGYDIENLTRPDIASQYRGPIHIDRYGRAVPGHAHGTLRLPEPTYSARLITEAAMELFSVITDQSLLVRRVTIAADHTVDAGTATEKMNLEADLFAELPEETEKNRQREKEKNIQQAINAIKEKFGKNSILKAMNMQEFATMRERNGQIGGHKA